MSNIKKPAAKGKKGFVMPEPIPLGEVLTDIHKRQWKVGPSIGKGGFGEIYTACEKDSKVHVDKYPYVVKIEPHDNGPLFVEMHFYMRNAKRDDIMEFSKAHKINKLGMPEYITSGSHTLPNKNKYRFLVMQRFTSDLQSYFKKLGSFSDYTILKLALQMTDVLEYIHSRAYVHADIKAANILLNSTMDQAYLVDFGLACRFNTQDFKPDPKKMHNGTIEYTSRDAHLGVPTRRGDFEILVYNLIHWAGGTLPWDKNLSSPVGVQALKEEAGKDVNQFLKKCFVKKEAPKYLAEFTKMIMSLSNNAEPSYKKIRAVFQSALLSIGKSQNGKFDFGTASNSNESASPKRSIKNVISQDELDKSSSLTKKLKKSPKKTSSTSRVRKVASPVVNSSSPKVSKTSIENIDYNNSLTKKTSGNRLAALKKTNILEYSICEDEDVEIIIKKKNIKTGEVKKTKTTVKTQKSESDSEDEKNNSETILTEHRVRQSPRINSRSKRYADDSADDINNSIEETLKERKKKNLKNTPTKQQDSKWKNSPTIKASAAASYLKKSKLTD
ncbi:serine/threonine-protein kinase VRK1 [Ctenocephalides felis]|uniref:serine/threonine-protein kinase VRK1 n=1 Tax=Ctenocephalides felis TaxID=7515 RepID=UPI000E6E531C|nr:serine/threonine-protein kinase VRK1 [Ctenocephalides felis]